MNLKTIVEALNLVSAEGEPLSEATITECYTSDLLSDVMGNASRGSIWITIHTHMNVVAVAALLELPAIIITGGNKPDPMTVERARSEGVAIFTTPKASFEVSGIIYGLLTK